MKTYTASIFVELEIRVSGTLTEGCRESHDPPSPAEPGGWEDVTVEGISYDGNQFLDASERALHVGDPISRALAGNSALRTFLTLLETEFSEQIAEALSAEVPDGPDPDDARDARIDEELRG